MHVTIYYSSRADEGTMSYLAAALEKKMTVSKWSIGPDPLISYTDLAFVLGDRFETLETVYRLNIEHVPIAHLAGGDLTEGSQDDCFRHAITKLSHLHFPTHIESAARIIQMGEQPSRVHMVGSVNVDRVLTTPLLTKETAFDILGLPTPDKYMLVCLHPNTLGNPSVELNALANALGHLINIKKILIGPNMDVGAVQIADKWKELAERADFAYFDTLPQNTYLTLLKHCEALVGNSSAGFTEAPVFGTPVVNIGDRQAGRPPAPCITDAEPTTLDIMGGISWALHLMKRFPFCSQYGDGHAAERIVDIVSKIEDPKALLRKQWYAPKT
jgi:UDP-hydrolysing UDP-N-acetyl-D-glucosamine 2-epimerase